MFKVKDLFQLDSNVVPAKSGRILISEPFGKIPFFQKSVIYIAEHSKEGSVGFILNKPILCPSEIFGGAIENYPWNLWQGGPIGTDHIFFIHTVGPNLIPNSYEIDNGIYWGGDFDQVINLLQEGLLNEKQIRFFVGYSGWEYKQLEKEIDEKIWKVSSLDTKEIMDTQSEIWNKAVDTLGGKYQFWKDIPTDPSLN